MIWIVHDEAGSYALRDTLEHAATCTSTLWIGIDGLPERNIGLCDLWVDQPFEAMAAAIARLAYPTVTETPLVITTLAGFSGAAERPVRVEDHTPTTLAFAQWILKGKARPQQVVLSGLSMLYERALAVVGGTLPVAKFDKAAELIPAFAGSALSHLFWDLKQSGVPVLASCWEVPSGKKSVPYLPMGVKSLADRVVKASAFPAAEWEEILNGTT